MINNIITNDEEFSYSYIHTVVTRPSLFALPLMAHLKAAGFSGTLFPAPHTPLGIMTAITTTPKISELSIHSVHRPARCQPCQKPASSSQPSWESTALRTPSCHPWGLGIVLLEAGLMPYFFNSLSSDLALPDF